MPDPSPSPTPGRDVGELPGHDAAAARLVSHDKSIYRAFDSLGLGFDHGSAIDYLNGSPSFVQATTMDARHLPCPVPNSDLVARLSGVVMAFAMTCVEADRAERPVEIVSKASSSVPAAGPTEESLGAALWEELKAWQRSAVDPDRPGTYTQAPVLWECEQIAQRLLARLASGTKTDGGEGTP